MVLGTFQEISKQVVPFLAACAAAALILLSPSAGADYPWINRLLHIGWLLVGGTLGAWIMRAVYKGGTDKITRRALESRLDAVARARVQLARDNARVAYALLAPFIASQDLSEAHQLAVRALQKMGRTGAAKELVFERLAVFDTMPLDELRQWYTIMQELGETETFHEKVRERLAHDGDPWLVELYVQQLRSQADPDSILSWLSSARGGTHWSEPARLVLRRAELQALEESVQSRLQLGESAVALQLLEQHHGALGTDPTWHMLVVQAQLKAGKSAEAIAAALQGYRLTGSPMLLAAVSDALQHHDQALPILYRLRDELGSGDSDGLLLYVVGWLFGNVGLHQEALPLLRRSISLPGPHQFFARLACSGIETQRRNLDAALKLVHEGSSWLLQVPLLWECGQCGHIAHTPDSVCRSCGAWHSTSVAHQPVPDTLRPGLGR